MTASKTDATTAEKSDEHNSEEPTFHDRFGMDRDTGYAQIVTESYNLLRMRNLHWEMDELDAAVSIDCDRYGVTLNKTAATDDGDTQHGSFMWLSAAEARQFASALLDAADDYEQYVEQTEATDE